MIYYENYPYYLGNTQQVNIPQNNTQANILYYNPNSNSYINYPQNSFSNNITYKPTPTNKQIIYSNSYPNNYYIKNESVSNPTIINNPITYNYDYNNTYTFNNQIPPENNTFVDTANNLNSNYEVIQNFQPNIYENKNTIIDNELRKLGIDTPKKVNEKPIQIINNKNELYSQFYNDE